MPLARGSSALPSVLFVVVVAVYYIVIVIVITIINIVIIIIIIIITIIVISRSLFGKTKKYNPKQDMAIDSKTYFEKHQKSFCMK